MFQLIKMMMVKLQQSLIHTQFVGMVFSHDIAAKRVTSIPRLSKDVDDE